MAEHNYLHDHTQELAEAQPAFDAAGQSLAKAFKTSFKALTVIIAFLAILFISKGIFVVEPDEVALILRFGETHEGLVKLKGFHYAFPYPIDEVIILPKNQQKMEVNSFWNKVTQEQQEAAVNKGTQVEHVEGAEDAFLLTGDMNVLQARWNITYTLNADDPSAVIKYFRKVGTSENEAKLVRNVLQGAVIRELCQMKVFDAYPRGTTDLPSMVRARVDATLRELDCGISVTQINMGDIRPPLAVKQAFEDVLSAQQSAKQAVIASESEKNRLLIEAAGEVGAKLGDAVNNWWAAKAAGDQQKMTAAQAEISELYKKAGGQVQTVIADAASYKVSIEQSAKGDAALMASLLRNPQKDIQMYLSVLYVDALRDMLQNSYEKFLFRPAQGSTRPSVELQINRRAELLREKRKIQQTN